MNYRTGEIDFKVEGSWNTEKYCLPVGREERLNWRPSRRTKTVTFWRWWQSFDSFCFETFSFFPCFAFFFLLLKKVALEVQGDGRAMATLMFDWFFSTQQASNLTQKFCRYKITIKQKLPNASHYCDSPSVFTECDKKVFSFVLVGLCISEITVLCITRYVQWLPTFIYFYWSSQCEMLYKNRCS